ncbi:SDR family oxidoreductase [Azospirillum sp.]|uniref:SDR family oxidoreductase n=1 Tax=Azospirillum sp. TaxID=34012 RepID=UPI002D3EBE35|nr:SDR family oxidoreductase [Azospirillum sp.]HYD66444.1 SDR family oxidoreductase [Azospirillum sp.]
MKIEAAGKRVVITAGAAGIGRVMAERFNAEGARVWICDIDQAALTDFRAANPAIGAVAADVAGESDMDRFFDEALADLGGLDVLVNNAGIAGPTKPVEEVTLEEWRRTLSVNLDSMFLATRRAVPELKKAGGGAIVNLSSIAGRLGFPKRSPYSTSKFGVVGFTETLAMELGAFNISVNAIQPGVVEGERGRRVIEAKAQALGKSYDEMEAFFLRHVSMHTKVSPDEIADMAIYLSCGPGRRISGQSISICGNFETFSEA